MTPTTSRFLLRVAQLFSFILVYVAAVYACALYPRYNWLIPALLISLTLFLCVWHHFLPRFREISSNIHEHLWFFVLAIGFLGVMVAYMAEAAGSSETYEGAHGFALVFFKKKAGELAVVVLLSILVDFIVMAFIRLQAHHKQLSEVGGIANASLEEAKKLEDIVARQVEDMGTTHEKLAAVAGRIDGIAKELGEDIPRRIDQVRASLERQAQILEWRYARQGAEQELFGELPRVLSSDRPLAVRKAGAFIAAVVTDSDGAKGAINSLRDRIASVLISYAKHPEYVPTLLATSCLRFTPLDDPLAKASEHLRTSAFKDEAQMPFGQNYLIANYGAMSQIVDKLYSEAENIYKVYSANGDDIEIVYLTTLPMLLEHYLNPDSWTGGLPSVVAQWDLTRDKTRRSVHHNDMGGPGRGHMWRFAMHSQNIEFKRVCLFLDDKAGARSDKRSIYREAEWRLARTTPAKVLRVYDSARAAVNLWRNRMAGRVEEVDSLRYEQHPQFVDVLHVDSLAGIGLWSPPSGEDKEDGEQRTPPSVQDMFVNLYHPKSSAARCFRLNAAAVQELFANTAFADCFKDGSWGRLVKAMKTPDSLDSTALAQDGYWYDIFFNRHIPLDLFAIGVKKRGEAAVAWQGCLGAYIGGDPNEMLLAWHDDVIETLNTQRYGEDCGKPWMATKQFLNLLYLKSERLIESGDDAPQGGAPEATETDFTRSYLEYPYGVGPSVAGEEVIEQLRTGRVPYGPVLDVGGAYGRDALCIADFLHRQGRQPIEVYVLDMNRQCLPKLNSLKAHYGAPSIAVHPIFGDVAILPSDWKDEAGASFDNAKRFAVIHSYHLLHLLSPERLKAALVRCWELLEDNGVMIHFFPSDADPFTRPDGRDWTTPTGERVKYFGYSFDQLSQICYELTGKPLSARGNLRLECRYVVELHSIHQSMLAIDEAANTPPLGEVAHLPQLHRHAMWMLHCKKKANRP